MSHLTVGRGPGAGGGGLGGVVDVDGVQQPGSGVERCGVFTGTRGRQLAGAAS